MTRGFQPLNLGSNPGACTNLYGKEFIIAYRIWNIMRCLSLLLTGILIFSGCLDFLDDENGNRTPLPIAGYEGNGPFEPNIEITFTGKGSSDPDGDILEYYWDFDSNDEKDESKIGDLANNGKITHSFNEEKTYTVTLTVSDGQYSAIATVKITIQKAVNEIRAIVTTEDSIEAKVTNDEKKTVTFSAEDSISESSITKYEWDFSYNVDDGFQTDEETNTYDVSNDFDSGVYTIKVRITNEMGETNEASSYDDIEMRINYEYEGTKSITGNDNQQEYSVQLYSPSVRYIKATLEYEAGVSEDDLDLYLYNHTQERNPDEDEGNDQEEECNVCVAKNYTHDWNNNEQVNYIELDSYNYTHREWFDEISELGDWFIVIDHERGNVDYNIKIEVIYWE